jgi:adenylosuccinate synthase
MLLDVLDAFDEIPLCVGYRLDGRPIRSFPPCVADAERIEPVYETLPGWKQDTTGARRWDDLPSAAKAYVARLGAIVGAEIGMVSVGPDREQSIIKPQGSIARRLGIA